MLYASVSPETRILEYPLSEAEVRTRLSAKNVSLPDSLANADLTEFGYHGVEALRPPDATLFTRVALGSPEWIGNQLVRTFEVVDRPIEDVQGDLIAQATAHYAELMSTGFPFDFGENGGKQFLQVRPEDYANWLILKSLSEDLAAAGKGSAPVGIRTLSNEVITVPATGAIKVMQALQIWGSGMMQKMWSAKDTIRLARTMDALKAVRIPDLFA